MTGVPLAVTALPVEPAYAAARGKADVGGTASSSSDPWVGEDEDHAVDGSAGAEASESDGSFDEAEGLDQELYEATREYDADLLAAGAKIDEDDEKESAPGAGQRHGAAAARAFLTREAAAA